MPHRAPPARALAAAAAARHDRALMDLAHAQAIAERVHASQREPNGAPILAHIRRVVSATPSEARNVAWLHEVLECGAITEQELLSEGLEDDELRALRLLSRPSMSQSTLVYLAHVELIACAAGPSGRLARLVKRADLEDRLRHPFVRSDGGVPPYDRGLRRLLAVDQDHGSLAGVAAESGLLVHLGARGGGRGADHIHHAARVRS